MVYEHHKFNQGVLTINAFQMTFSRPSVPIKYRNRHEALTLHLLTTQPDSSQIDISF